MQTSAFWFILFIRYLFVTLHPNCIIMVYSQNEFKRLGDRIRMSPDNIEEQDLQMLQELRLSYKDDLSAVFNILVGEASKVDKKSIRTYRIKRIESIISKLLREPGMQLQRMSDVAGCRCIMQSNKQVYSLFERLKKKIVVKNFNDYIDGPKDTGYKSLHLIVKLNESSKKTIEIQLRSVEEHNWATLVEITDLIYHTRLKETGKGHELSEFHRLLSIGTTRLDIEQKKRLIDIAKKYDYFFKISEIFSQNYIEVRDQWNKSKQSFNNFFLVSTGDDGKPEISAYRSFDKAEEQYFIKYNENKANKNIVLTHISNATFEDISMAYSNYFLTYNALFFNCHKVISDLVIDAYQQHKCYSFYKLYKYFWEITLHMLGVHTRDLIELQHKKMVVQSLKKKNQWMRSIQDHIGNIATVFNRTNTELNKCKHHIICAFIRSWIFKKYLHKEIIPYRSKAK